MEEPGVYYAKLIKSERERQIPYDFTYVLNLKQKIQEHTKHRHKQHLDGCQMTGFGGLNIGSEGIEKYALAVTKQSWVCAA